MLDWDNAGSAGVWQAWKFLGATGDRHRTYVFQEISSLYQGSWGACPVVRAERTPSDGGSHAVSGALVGTELARCPVVHDTKQSDAERLHRLHRTCPGRARATNSWSTQVKPARKAR